MLAYIGMFLLALTMELCAAGYTIAIARSKDNWAVILSAASAVLGWGILLYVVTDIQTMPAAIAGEVLGTVAALRISKRRR